MTELLTQVEHRALKTSYFFLDIFGTNNFFSPSFATNYFFFRFGPIKLQYTILKDPGFSILV